MHLLRVKKLHHRVVIYALVALFCLSTANIALSMYDAYRAFITHRDAPGTMIHLDDYQNPVPIAANLVYGISILIADLFLVWRLYSIWPSNKIAFVVLGILIFLLTCCGFTIGFFEIAQIIAGDARFVPRITTLTTVVFLMVLTTNIGVTGLIAGRLWWMNKKVAILGPQANMLYYRIMHIFLSSGALYAGVILIQVIIYAAGIKGLIYFFLRCNPSIVALFPTLMILQLNLSPNDGATRSTGPPPPTPVPPRFQISTDVSTTTQRQTRESPASDHLFLTQLEYRAFGLCLNCAAESASETMSAKRKNADSLSPPNTPSATRAYKRRKNDRDASVVPINLKGMKSGTGVADDAHGKDHDDDAEEDEGALLEEDDYTTQLNWQSQSKANLKILMENFTQDQHDRYEQYRRSAINKNTVRKFINHTFGTNPSMNVAQVISGFSKVFVGEMVEKARQVQAARGATGPLAPEDLREAYRIYVEEKGKIGAALPHRGKRLFVR
ncbi:hypothetical protein FRB99_005966 [Tulasnella sp. 403]|nr:hypothetical protein FRB99_005966 [Tulasnella sp. 403]